MKLAHFFAFVLSVSFTACSSKHSAEQNNAMDRLNWQIKELTSENDALRHRFDSTQGVGGLSNAQILHTRLRDTRIAAMLRDGRSTDAIALLEQDTPSFVKFYRASGRFSDRDIWILHEIRDHYQKYHLPMGAEMASALPTPYPPCDSSPVSANP